MAALDEANCEKKLRGVSTTQESIQSLGLWIIHHKAHHEKIVDIWFKVLKKSPASHRLTLFYLCNDIVQSCKRKHAVVYKDAFKEILKDAVLMVKDNAVRPNVERIFNIWEERKVYDAEFVEDLTAILNNTKVRATSSSKLLTEFKPQALIDKMITFKKSDDELSQKQWQVTYLRLDTSAVEAVKQLKDRAHGKEFSQTFEENCLKLEEVMAMSEKQTVERQALVEMLEQSELFYDAQYGEAKIVANAYKNFGTRVNNLRKRLEEHKKSLPEPPSPVPSPDLDAPSPENSPCQDEMVPSVPPVNDNVEILDMEMSEEEAEGGELAEPGAGRRDSTTTTRSYYQPIASVTHIQMKKSRKKYLLNENNSPKSLDSAPSPTASPVLRLSPEQTRKSQTAHSFLPELVMGAQSTFMAPPQEDTGRESGDATPVKDEGACTPVQDEQPDPGSLVANPIEFLQQLISKGQKTSMGNSEGGASKFLEGLSFLTETVKNQITKDKSSEKTADEAPVPAWTPWDAQQPNEVQHQAESQVPPYLQTPSPEPMTGPGPFAPSPSSHPVPQSTFGPPVVQYVPQTGPPGLGQSPPLQPPPQQEPTSPQPNYYQPPPMGTQMPPPGMNIPMPGMIPTGVPPPPQQMTPDALNMVPGHQHLQHADLNQQQPIVSSQADAPQSAPQNPWSYPPPNAFPHSAPGPEANNTYPPPGQPPLTPQPGIQNYQPSQQSEPSTTVSYVETSPVYAPQRQQPDGPAYPPPDHDAPAYPPPEHDAPVYRPADHDAPVYPPPDHDAPAYPPPEQQQDPNQLPYHVLTSQDRIQHHTLQPQDGMQHHSMPPQDNMQHHTLPPDGMQHHTMPPQDGMQHHALPPQDNMQHHAMPPQDSRSHHTLPPQDSRPHFYNEQSHSNLPSNFSNMNQEPSHQNYQHQPDNTYQQQQSRDQAEISGSNYYHLSGDESNTRYDKPPGTAPNLFQKRLQDLSRFNKRFPGRSNLTTVTTHDDSSEGQYGEEDGGYQEGGVYQDESTSPISTITTRATIRHRSRSGSFPPRPPSQPPSPQTVGHVGLVTNRDKAGGSGAQREFIEKLKRKSSTGLLPTPALSPAPRGILKGVVKEKFLRTLTEVEPGEIIDNPPEEMPVSEGGDHLPTNGNEDNVVVSGAMSSEEKDHAVVQEDNTAVEQITAEEGEIDCAENKEGEQESGEPAIDKSSKEEEEGEKGEQMMDHGEDGEPNTHDSPHVEPNMHASHGEPNMHASSHGEPNMHASPHGEPNMHASPRGEPNMHPSPHRGHFSEANRERRRSFEPEHIESFRDGFHRSGYPPRRPPPPRDWDNHYYRRPFPRRAPPPFGFDRRFRPRY